MIYLTPITFNGKQPNTPRVVVANRDDNNSQALPIRLPVLDAAQTVTLHWVDSDANGQEIPLEARSVPGEYLWVVSETDTRKKADLSVWLEITVGDDTLWVSDTFIASVGQRLSHNNIIAQRYPDKLQELINDVKELQENDSSGTVTSVNGVPPDENGNVEIETVSQEQIQQAVEKYLTENPVSGGLSTEASNLLVTILRNGVYSTDQSANITALASKLGVTEEEEPDTPVEPDEPVEPEVTLSSISATYSGGDVAVGTAVTDLTGIVVTAHYSDGSTTTVTGYTLSGTIVEGSNTITVSYGGKTTTFTVTGVAEEPATVYELGSKKYTIPAASAWTDESGATIDAPADSGGIYFLSNDTFENGTNLAIEFSYAKTYSHGIYIGSYDGNTVSKTRVIAIKQYHEGTNFTENYSVNAGCQLVVGFTNAVSPAITVTGV